MPKAESFIEISVRDWVGPSGVASDRQQEHKQHMSKSEEDKLMSEFFQARRQERCEEKELLLQDRHNELDPLKDKEFVGGSVFDRCSKLAIALVRESERCDALFRHRWGLSFVY